jgi:hypothetical protein
MTVKEMKPVRFASPALLFSVCIAKGWRELRLSRYDAGKSTILRLTG